MPIQSLFNFDKRIYMDSRKLNRSMKTLFQNNDARHNEGESVFAENLIET